MDKLDQYISGVEHLPPAPTVVVELLGLFKEVDRDLERVIELLSHDPALAAEILKRCNSVFFGGDNPAEDVFEAVSRLGFYEIYRIVTALFGSRALTLGGKATGLDVGKVWEHSVTTAVAAAVLARRLDETEALAFTAGLLHDVGRVILAEAEPDYAEVAQTTGGKGQLFVEAERRKYGVDHAQLGARLLTLWKLPDNVVAAVRHHHHLAGAEPFQQLAATVHLADALAHRLSDETESADAPINVSAYALSIVKLKHDEVGELIGQIREELQHAPELTAA